MIMRGPNAKWRSSERKFSSTWATTEPNSALEDALTLTHLHPRSRSSDMPLIVRTVDRFHAIETASDFGERNGHCAANREWIQCRWRDRHVISNFTVNAALLSHLNYSYAYLRLQKRTNRKEKHLWLKDLVYGWSCSITTRSSLTSVRPTRLRLPTFGDGGHTYATVS